MLHQDNNDPSESQEDALFSALAAAGRGKTSSLMHNGAILTSNVPQFRTVLAHPVSPQSLLY